MKLEEALEYSRKKLSYGERSDGCTFAPNLGIKKWCIMHDMLRRFKPVTASEADRLFLEGIKTKGYRYYPVAYIYYIAVVAARKLGVYK